MRQVALIFALLLPSGAVLGQIPPFLPPDAPKQADFPTSGNSEGEVAMRGQIQRLLAENAALKQQIGRKPAVVTPNSPQPGVWEVAILGNLGDEVWIDPSGGENGYFSLFGHIRTYKLILSRRISAHAKPYSIAVGNARGFRHYRLIPQPGKSITLDFRQ